MSLYHYFLYTIIKLPTEIRDRNKALNSVRIEKEKKSLVFFGSRIDWEKNLCKKNQKTP